MCGKLSFDGRLQQAFVGILYGLCHLFSARVVATDKAAFQTLYTFLVIRTYADFQQTFGFGTTDGEQLVRGTFLQWFTEFEVIPVFICFSFFSFHYFGGDDGLPGEGKTHGVACLFVFADLFGNDVSCPFQCVFGIFHFSFDVCFRTLLGVGFPLQHQ